MTQQEAVALINTWITEYSPFAAQVVKACRGEQGSWLIEVECSEVIWQQTVSPEGEVSTPILLD